MQSAPGCIIEAVQSTAQYSTGAIRRKSIDERELAAYDAISIMLPA
ncbi:MAG: hypothetical protein JXA74_05825 [Anaerolineae bacterium]|nr:hypothetical protein [Anaerolineae bacterium]